jgi:hypothetical protein
VITERDESLHSPGSEMPERWQENMMFYGWDADHAIGFYFHVQRIPYRSFTEVKVVVCQPHDGVSGRAVVPMPDASMYDGLVIDEPFRRTRLSFAGSGDTLRGPASLATVSDAGSIPYSIDLTFTGLAGPADWYEPLSKMSSTETTHYQVAGTFEGTLGYGDHSIGASGMFWRDHTWGIRNYTPEEHEISDGRGGLHSSWFTPLVFDEGHTLVNGLWIRLMDGREQQFVVLSEGASTSYFDEFAVEVIEGTQEIGAYRSVRITGGDQQSPIDCRLDVARHLPIWLPDHGPHTVLNEGFGTVTWGSKTGWGSAELMETLPDWRERPAFAEQLAAA